MLNEEKVKNLKIGLPQKYGHSGKVNTILGPITSLMSIYGCGGVGELHKLHWSLHGQKIQY